MGKKQKERQLHYYKTVLGYINGDPACVSEIKENNFKSIFIATIISCIVCFLFTFVFTLTEILGSFMGNFKTIFLVFGLPVIIGSVLDYLFPYLDDRGYYYSFGGLILLSIIQKFFGITASAIITTLVLLLIIIKMEKTYKKSMKEKALSKLSKLEAEQI